MNRYGKIMMNAQEYRREIEILFFDRLGELGDTGAGVNARLSNDIKQAFEFLETEGALTAEEKSDLSYCLGSALVDATESLLFEFLLEKGYYKSEDDICQDGEYSFCLSENDGRPYIDSRLKSEMTVYATLSKELFSDDSYLKEQYTGLLDKFEIGRKEKAFLGICNLWEELKNDIDGLQTNLEALESVDQLTESAETRINAQIYVLQMVFDRVAVIIKEYYGVHQQGYTDEQMRDYLNFKGYDVGDALDMLAKARALNYEFDDTIERWVKEGQGEPLLNPKLNYDA